MAAFVCKENIFVWCSVRTIIYIGLINKYFFFASDFTDKNLKIILQTEKLLYLSFGEEEEINGKMQYGIQLKLFKHSACIFVYKNVFMYRILYEYILYGVSVWCLAICLVMDQKMGDVGAVQNKTYSKGKVRAF